MRHPPFFPSLVACLVLVSTKNHLAVADCDVNQMTATCYSNVGLAQPTLMSGEPSEAYTLNAILDFTLLSTFCNNSDAFKAALSCQISGALGCLYQGTPAPGAVDMRTLMPEAGRVYDPKTVDLVCKCAAKWNEPCAIQQMELFSMCQMQQAQQLSEKNATIQNDKKDYTCAIYRSMRDCAKTTFHVCGCAAEKMVTYFVGYAMYPVACGQPSAYDVECSPVDAQQFEDTTQTTGRGNMNVPQIFATLVGGVILFILR